MPDNQTSKPLILWLYACCALVFLMVVVGGITRLTESGLSIVEWKPLVGAIPPITEAAWNKVFSLYQQTPEYKLKNFWMTLDDFKRIFFWEWFHRLLGRIIGLAYGLPLLWFWITKKIPHGYKLKLLIPFLLGGAQGALGWYMVKSGLIDNPAVSHFRLAAHLGLALVIYALMLWLALSLRSKDSPSPLGGEGRGEGSLFAHALLTLLFLITTITWGAFTAGLDAGLAYTDSFPKMGGAWIPPEATQSVIDNPAGVQFLHRWLAIATVLMIFGFWIHAQIKQCTAGVIHILAAFVFVQAGLGILTLFTQVWVPVAALHQAGAVILLTLMITTLHRLTRRQMNP